MSVRLPPQFADTSCVSIVRAGRILLYSALRVVALEKRADGRATAKGKIEYRGTPACREACLHVGCGSTGRDSARARSSVMRARMLAKSRVVRVGMRRAAMGCSS